MNRLPDYPVRTMQPKQYSLLHEACLHTRLSSELEVVNKKLSLVAELSSEDFLPGNYRLGIYKSVILTQVQNQELLTLLQSGGNYHSFSELVSDMEFHNVINHRLNHIIKTNQRIINRLSDFELKTPDAETKDFIRLIPQLCTINQVQLHVLTAEYTALLMNLQKALDLINDRLHIESTPCMVYYFNNISFFKLLTETINDTFQSIVAYVEKEYSSNSKTDHNAIKMLQNIYTMDVELEILLKTLQYKRRNIELESIKELVFNEIISAKKERLTN